MSNLSLYVARFLCNEFEYEIPEMSSALPACQRSKQPEGTRATLSQWRACDPCVRVCRSHSFFHSTYHRDE